MAGSAGGGEGEPEFQVAPMIDVLLTILIFFMTITSAQVLKVDKTIKLPVAPDAQKKDSQRSEAIVNVRWNPATRKATFVYNDIAYTESSQLVPLLKSAKAAGDKKISESQNQEFRIVIRGDRDVPAMHVSEVMDAAAAAGIADISFAAMNKD
ncbi:MAG: biopolymer transporter ExbD [Chthoniobacteraceae bacterium]|jgi:biopolymer transport protein ExbD